MRFHWTLSFIGFLSTSFDSCCLSLPFCFTHFLRAFSFAAALAALGAKGSDTSNAISDDLPFIGFFCLPPFIVYIYLNRVLLPSFFFRSRTRRSGRRRQ